MAFAFMNINEAVPVSQRASLTLKLAWPSGVSDGHDLGFGSKSA